MNMVIRRTLFVLMCLLASSLYMYGQIGVKMIISGYPSGQSWRGCSCYTEFGGRSRFEQEADSGCAHVLQSMEI